MLGLAEREGFEPSMQVTPHGGLANRCTRPLCDLSVAAAAGILSWRLRRPDQPRRRPGVHDAQPRGRTAGRHDRRADSGGWPDRSRRVRPRVGAPVPARGGSGPCDARLAHAGSTSVPGLAAKPIIDMVLAVADSADEAAYVPPLESAGYVLRIREPDWHEHRLFKGPDTNINLHTFSDGSTEIRRMLAFRDRLRTHDDERDLYLATKRELAARHWTYVQDYADAKGEVVEAIIARAVADDARPDAR